MCTFALAHLLNYYLSYIFALNQTKIKSLLTLNIEGDLPSTVKFIYRTHFFFSSAMYTDTEPRVCCMASLACRRLICPQPVDARLSLARN